LELPGQNRSKITQDPKDQLKVQIKHFPGEGSVGTPVAEGGEGSKGGLGPYFEWVDMYDYCSLTCSLVSKSLVVKKASYQFPHGAAGARGVKGKNGARGLDGNVLDSKIILKKPNLEFIINFDWNSFN
jgi:hypothetical protein